MVGNSKGIVYIERLLEDLVYVLRVVCPKLRKGQI